MSARLILALFERPRLAWGLFAVISAAALFGLTRLGFDDDYLNLLRSRDSGFTALETSYQDFENEVNDLVIVIDRDDGVITVPVLAALRRLVELLSQHPHFDKPLSVFDAAGPLRFNLKTRPLIPEVLDDETPIAQLEQELVSHPIIGRRFLSEDGQMMLSIVAVRSDDNGQIPTTIMRERLSEAWALVDESGLEAHARVRFTGPPAIRTVVVETLFRDQLVFGVGAVVLALVVGLTLFRSVSCAAIVVVPAAVGVGWTFGLMGLMGEPINLINGTVAPLLLAIAVSDTIHLILDFHRRLRGGAAPHAAMRTTLRRLGPACVLTSVTTAVGFGSLMAADIGLIARLGFLCAVGVFLCLFAVVVLVPRWAVSGYGIRASFRPRLPTSLAAPRFLVNTWRRPRGVMVVSSLLFFALVVVASNVRVDVRATTELPPESEQYQTFRDVEDKFGGLLSAHVVVNWPEGKTVASPELRTVLAEIHKALDATGVAGAPFSLLTIERAARGPFGELDGQGGYFAFAAKSVLRRVAEPHSRSLLVHARMRDAGARELMPVLAELRRELDLIELRHPGFKLTQTGLMPVHVATINRVITTLARSLLIALPIIVFSIGFAFRSPLWALAAVIPNVLPLVAIAVYLVAADWHIGIAGALSFTVALGIAVDDTIHFLERTRMNLSEGLEVSAAVTRAWTAVVPAMMATTAIFTAAYGLLGLSEFSGLQAFSGLCCLAFGVALIADLVILPAWIIGLAGPRLSSLDADHTIAP